MFIFGRIAVVAVAISMLIAPICSADSINIGFVAFDVTNPPLGEFDIVNLTGPNSSTLPDTTFPVTTSVSLTGLSLTVNFVAGGSSTFGSSYFTLGADGLSFDGQNIFNTSTNAVESASLTGTFGATDLTLNDGTSVSIDPNFSVMLSDSGGSLIDGDLALLTAASSGGGPVVPEPGTCALILAGLGALSILRKRILRKPGKAVLLGVLSGSFLLAVPFCASAATTPVKLNAVTSPGSGVAGNSNVWITGLGFPSGSISSANMTVTFANTCGGSAAASTSAIAVRTVAGSTERVEVLVPASLSQKGYFVSLQGTTSTGAAFASSNCSSIQVTTSNVSFSSCNPGSSMGLIVPNKTGSGVTPVTAYVPNGWWGSGVTGVRVVPIEGSGSVGSIATPSRTNSCSSNSQTGETVCVANNTDIYLVTGTALNRTLTSGSDTFAGFSGGSCQNCGVAVNSVRNQAVIQIGLQSAPSGSGLQFLDLGTNTLGTPVPATTEVSEDILWDPLLNFVLSPNEGDTYNIYKVTTALGVPPSPTTVGEFANGRIAASGVFDSAGEDCSTGVALATVEGSEQLFIADLKQAKLTNGSPGTWTAPQQLQSFPEFFNLSAGTSGIAIAPGTTHLGVVAGEFGGNVVGAIQLPSNSGSGAGTPAVVDWVVASLPPAPDGSAFSNGFDPHTTTAYTSPNDGKAYAILADWNSGEPAWLAVIDLQAMLNATRTGTNTHTVDPSVDLVAAGIVRYVKTS